MIYNKPILKVTAGEAPPLSYVQQRSDGNLTISGPMGSLLDILSEKLHFDYELVRPADGIYCGSQYPNGSWKGMIGLLETRGADIAMGPCSNNPLWGNEFAFSTPTYTGFNALIMRRAGVEYNIQSFLKPFASEVWILVIVSIFIVCLTMGFLVWAEEKFTVFKTPNLISRTAFWVVQAIAQESSDWLPVLDAGRLLVVTWLLASLVFMTSYAGILTAMLTVPSPNIPIDSTADLVEQSDIPWRMRIGSFMYQFFRDSEGEVEKKVFAGSSPMSGSCWRNRQVIRDGEYVAICISFTMWQMLAWDFSENAECHFYMARTKVYTMNHGVMVFQSNSPYREPTDEIIMRLHAAGLLNKWMADETRNATKCLQPSGTRVREGAPPALSLDALLGPFALLGIGLLAGSFCFLSEILVNRIYRQPDFGSVEP